MSCVRLGPRSGALGALILVIVAAAVWALATDHGGASETPDPLADGCQTAGIRLGVDLPRGEGPAQSAARHFAHALADVIGCPVRLVVRHEQAGLVSALALQRVDLAQLDPAAMVVAERVTSSSPLGAFADDADSPSVTTRGALFVRAGSPVTTLADLRGRRVALGPRLTAATDVAPRRAMVGAGLRPGRDVRVVRTSTTSAGLEALRRRRVDAAVLRVPAARALGRDGHATSSVAPALAVAAGWATRTRTAGLHEVLRFAPVPADVVAMRPGVPSKIKGQIVSAVRSLAPQDLAPVAARQGIALPAPLLPVSEDLYGPLGDDLDAIAAAGVAP